MRNKAKIASGVVKTVVAGVLTGGIGAVAVVGGAVVSYAGKRVYRRVQSASALSNVEYVTEHFGGATRTAQSHGGEHSTGKSILEVNYIHSLVLSEIATLCSNDSLTKIMTAFAELEADAKALQEAMQKFTNIQSCDDAWSLLEHVERIKLREADLSDAFDLFQEFIEYIVLVTSSFEDDFDSLNNFEWRRKRAIGLILDKCSGSTAAALELLNTEANSSDVFHTSFFSRNKDFRGWITLHNPELGLPGSVINVSNGLSSLGTGAATTLTAGIAKSSATTGASTGLTVMSNAIGGINLLSGVTTASKGVAGEALSSIGAAGSSAGIGIVSDVVFQSLANYVDQKLLDKNWDELREKLNAPGSSQKPMLEIFDEVDQQTVAALRTGAKKIISTTASKVSHLVEADQGLNFVNMPSSKASEIAKMLMRRQKLQDQVAGLTPLLFMFHESTTARSMHLIKSSKDLQANIKNRIVAWIDQHATSPCKHDSAVCYADAFRVLNKEILHYGIQLTQSQNSFLQNCWEGKPLHPGPAGQHGLRKLLDNL